MMSHGLDVRVQETSPAENARKTESYLINLIEKADTLRKHEKLLNRIAEGTLDVPGYLKAVSVEAALQLAHLLHSGENDKIKLEAAKDILDRAGYNKTAKVAIAGVMQVDHDTSKLELINLILSSAKKVGLKTKEERDDPPPKTLDVPFIAPGYHIMHDGSGVANAPGNPEVHHGGEGHLRDDNDQ